MDSQTRTFKSNAKTAMADDQLAAALTRLGEGFPLRRAEAIDRLPEFDQLRDAAKAIKDHTLEHLDLYLEQYEARVTESGGHVHWCRTAQDAREKILEICRSVGAKTVTKSKSMIGEEIAINDFLEENGVAPVETDLGEYIIQLRKEPPSHIIAPAVHLNKGQVEETFREAHRELDPARDLEDPRSLLEEARVELREKFLTADVGLTGANFLIAETGTNVLVTNEGNADLTYSLPRIHIVIASLEKVIPTLEDTATVLRVLARSGTGQDITVYTTFCTGPKRPDDLEGPEEYHVVLLDNGRTDLVGTEFQEMLRCIRCGSCLNHCPVYQSIGGHAYGWVYPGPMGSVLTPSLIGVEEAGHDFFKVALRIRPPTREDATMTLQGLELWPSAQISLQPTGAAGGGGGGLDKCKILVGDVSTADTRCRGVPFSPGIEICNAVFGGVVWWWVGGHYVRVRFRFRWGSNN